MDAAAQAERGGALLSGVVAHALEFARAPLGAPGAPGGAVGEARALGSALEDACCASGAGSSRQGAPLHALAATENRALSKAAAALAHVVAEARALRAEAEQRQLPRLAALAERVRGALARGGDAAAARASEAVAAALPALAELSAFAAHASSIARNALHQLAALHAGAELGSKGAALAAAPLAPAFAAAGDALASLAVLDAALQAAPWLDQALEGYRALLLEATAAEAGVGGNQNGDAGDKAGGVGEVVAAASLVDGLLHGLVRAGHLVTCVQGLVGQAELEGTRMLAALQRSAIGRLQVLAPAVKDGGAEVLRDSHGILSALCLAVAHAWLVARDGEGAYDRRSLRALFEVRRACPLLHVWCHLMVAPSELLAASLPPAALAAAERALGGVEAHLAAAANERAAASAALDERLTREMTLAVSALQGWMVAEEARGAPRDADMQRWSERRARMALSGTRLAARVQHLVRTTLELHATAQAPLSRGLIRPLVRGLAALAGARAAIARRTLVWGAVRDWAIDERLDSLAEALAPLAQALEQSLVSSGGHRSTGGYFSGGRRKSGAARAVADDAALDALAAARLSANCLGAGVSPRALALASVGCDIALSLGGASPGAAAAVEFALAELHDVAAADVEALRATDCSFLFWHRELLPLMLRSCLADGLGAPVLPHALAAARHAERVLESLDGDEEGAGAASGSLSPADAWGEELAEIVEAEVLRPSFAAVETSLRQLLHSTHLSGASLAGEAKAVEGGRGQVQGDVTTSAAAAVLRLPALELRGARLHAHSLCEQHLAALFYDHVAVSPGDWRTYSEMRSICRSVYGLSVPEAALPSATLEQGLDVLELMRNVHTFVSEFCYYLNGNLFVEKLGAASERKHLHTISVRHIANSIRMHGAGVVDTIVNFIFQFLASRMTQLSSLLLDDLVRSPLVREVRHIERQRAKAEAAARERQRKALSVGLADLDYEEEDAAGARRGSLVADPTTARISQPYPIERARDLVDGLKRLAKQQQQPGGADGGAAPPKGGHLIGLVRVVTEIGNALGFARLVASAAAQRAAAAAPFVAYVDGGGSAKKAAEKAKLPRTTADAAGALDATVEALHAASEGRVNYLHALVDVFADSLRGDAHAHLADFFAAAPALVLVAAEGNMAARERLSRRGAETKAGARAAALGTFAAGGAAGGGGVYDVGAEGGGMVDDGFAVGLAYLLQVLGQQERFGSLSWWESVRAHYDAEARRLASGTAPAQSTGVGGRRAAGLAMAGGGSRSRGGLTQEETFNLELLQKKCKAQRAEHELLECAFECASSVFAH